MGGEQAANVLVTVAKDQKKRQKKPEVHIFIFSIIKNVKNLAF